MTSESSMPRGHTLSSHNNSVRKQIRYLVHNVVKAVLELSTVLTVVASSVETSCWLVSDSLGGGTVHIHDYRDLVCELDNIMTRDLTRLLHTGLTGVL